ncbi:uncharacterized protein LOC141677352 isoform X2 [Apium graveolens]|uniref:uncharacterized protein LOC141677352 isoform X2 n=1 Tax=Apium graveolens TaxID=4045 RepID=UPI003D7BA301
MSTFTANIPPTTIYINNLNDKVKKGELKRSLYALFSQFGRILDIVLSKKPQLRGQAWVVFSDFTAADKALGQMQNFIFYDKPMFIHYAKTKSDCVAKADGSFIPKDVKKKQEVKAERKEQEPHPVGTTGVRAETKAGPVEFKGIPLLEVLNLVYMGNDEIESEDQLGSILLEFDSGSKRFYRQNMFNLFRGAYKDSLKVKFEPVGDKVWSEKRIIWSVDGTGQICVVFGGLSNATVANLKVNISGARDRDVHGIVAARNNQLDTPSCTNVLFWKSLSNKIEVGSDGAIPLSRSNVGVPLGSVFFVDVALSVDGLIHRGTASFVPQIKGEKVEKITFHNKETIISVEVKWDSREKTVFSTYWSVDREPVEGEYDSEEDSEGYEHED